MEGVDLNRVRISFKDLPWDCMSVLIDYLPLNDLVADLNQRLYKSVRLINRDFYRLICQKRKSLLFCDQNVTERVFISLLEKCSTGSIGS